MLPQLTSARPYLTDGGVETSLIFNRGVELPAFAAFVLLREPDGRDMLREYYREYLNIAASCGAGFILESVTWRASRDWGELLGYSSSQLATANQQAIDLLSELRQEYASTVDSMLISGCIGPRDDGYRPAKRMTVDEAHEYHAEQTGTLAHAEVDMYCALTLTYVDEAIGIARAAEDAGIPVAISFTVETDGRLPSGQALGSAISEVDAETEEYPAYYMINCAHPVHFADVLGEDDPGVARIRGLRANASTRSHAELDEAEDLDAGDPQDLASRYADLCARRPALNVLGGCCGTDARHVAAIARSVGLVSRTGNVS